MPIILWSFDVVIAFVDENVCWEYNLFQVADNKLLHGIGPENFHVLEDDRLGQRTYVRRRLRLTRLNDPDRGLVNHQYETI